MMTSSSAARWSLISLGVILIVTLLLADLVLRRRHYEQGFWNPPPLVAALRQGDTQRVRQLVAAGADVNEGDVDGVTPLMMAVVKADVRTVQFLLMNHAEVNQRDGWGDTALHRAARFARPVVRDAAEILLENGADVNARGYLGRTPLMETAKICTPDKTQLYLRHGADPAIKDTRGQTAMDHASGRSGEGFDPCPEIIELLLKAQETSPSADHGPGRPAGSE